MKLMNRKRIHVEVTQEHLLFVIIMVIWKFMGLLPLLINVVNTDDLVSTGQIQMNNFSDSLIQNPN